MSEQTLTVKRQSLTEILIVPALSVFYLLMSAWLTGLRNDHFVLVGIVNALYFASKETRRLITGLSVIVIYWIIFDSMKAWPNYKFGNVDIMPLFNLEKKLFGINENGIRIIPSQYFILHSSTVLDLICSSFYLFWVPAPLIFAFYTYFKHKNLFLRFSLAFFFVNLLGFVVYYTHPAAPPWYALEHGDVFIAGTKSNAAGLLRFDNYFGVHLFRDLYSKGSNVFAAMPSLHSAYPLIALFYSLKQPKKIMSIFLAAITVGIWFSAIYLTHHYILDVIAGVTCAVVGLFILEKLIARQKWYQDFLRAFELKISKE